jgi:NAD(P)H-hydrate epimerase
LPAQAVLTPHPAEMARLCATTPGEVTARAWEMARAQAAEWGAVVLLKGPYTVIAAPGGELAVLPVATPALATAGSGDVLAGAIAGLLAQGVEPFEAACLGAWLHGAAGKLCEAEMGLAGTVAGDLIGRLPRAMEHLRRRA